MRIRTSTPDDASALAEVYGDSVLKGVGTFEEEPPTADVMAARRAAVVGLDLPYLVAEDEAGEILGFAYASPFRPRAAYRHTVEDSVYVAPAARGRGVGQALLHAVVEACEAQGLRRLLALIGDSDNAGSIALHAACGFEVAGVLPGVGYKHGRWLDVVCMARALNGGTGRAPDRPGLALDGAAPLPAARRDD